MRCMAEETATRPQTKLKSGPESNAKLSWLLIGAIACSTAAAQQPGVVPTDHYGPPACTVDAKPPVKSPAADEARTEQKGALENSRIILSVDALPNFGVQRYKLQQYGDCTGDNGCYWADLDAQYKRAEAELAKQIAAKKSGEKLAIVMDIDETTLSNYCEMRREDFGYIAPLYSRWETSPEAATAIPGALRLYNKAREAGIAVFFITGRPGVPDFSAGHEQTDETDTTAKNLEAAGFRGYEALQLRNGTERTMPTIDYKSSERERIVRRGYRIIMSLGDQWSDLLGDPQADISIKLPNPFYFIP
jgi:HAD superfamily, subfamily IIIB (Acid phosphatase)